MTLEPDELRIPADHEEANQLLEWLGAARREQARIETLMNDEIAAVKARHEAIAAPQGACVSRCEAGLREWANANRAELTAGGKRKSFRLPAGEIGWRGKKPRVVLGKKKAIEGIIAQIHTMALHARGAAMTVLLGFIRTREEINKEAMLAEPEIAAAIPGVKIKSGGDEFYAAPYELPLSDGIKADAP